MAAEIQAGAGIAAMAQSLQNEGLALDAMHKTLENSDQAANPQAGAKVETGNNAQPATPGEGEGLNINKMV